MHLLRRALIDAGGHDPIETVHGLGYRLLDRARPV
jgi:DNA-binding response OmpR family regulator